MADLSDEDKRSLLGPNFKEIEAANAKKKSRFNGKLKSVLVVAAFAAFASAILLADFGFAIH